MIRSDHIVTIIASDSSLGNYRIKTFFRQHFPLISHRTNSILSLRAKKLSRFPGVIPKKFDCKIDLKERIIMANSKHVVPEAKEAMEKFKMEAANEVGVNLKQGYNGDLTSRQAGSIGGQMVKKMIESYENSIK